VLPAFKLVIEIDGDTHSSQESKDYDLERSQRLEGYGLQVVRFTNEEVLADFEGVYLRIVAQMQRPTIIYALTETHDHHL
jgi:very-short-patch-repair endonuclease